MNWHQPYISVGIVPGSSPPAIRTWWTHLQWQNGIVSVCIKFQTIQSWKKVATLPSVRGRVAVATVSNNAIIVIGGSTQGGRLNDALAHSLTLVELGQVGVKKPPIIDF